jgi:hypothetical protein
MLRISKNSGRIEAIKRNSQNIDSFVIIPGVTTYSSIFSQGKVLWFTSLDPSSTITLYFTTDSDLERFFTTLLRDIKINQILVEK